MSSLDRQTLPDDDHDGVLCTRLVGTSREYVGYTGTRYHNAMQAFVQQRLLWPEKPDLLCWKGCADSRSTAAVRRVRARVIQYQDA